MRRRAALILFCALATLASAFRFTAPPGPGLDPDAMSYLGAAESVARTGAFRIPAAPWFADSTTAPLTHFPPGYSSVIAVGITLGADARTAARVTQAIAAAGTVALAMLILWPMAGGIGATLGATAIVLSPAFVLVHLSVLSEPLFLALVTLALWAMARRPRALGLHALIAAAATMVRYAGLAVAGAVALWALRDRQASWPSRLRRATLAVAPSLIAMFAWSASRRFAPGYARPIRKFAMYGNWGPTLHEGWNTLGHLLAPSLEWDPVPTLAALGTLVAIAALAWVADDAPRDDVRHADARHTVHAAGVIALCYAGLVFASRLLADPAIPFDFRLAAPLVPVATIAVVVVAARAWTRMGTPARVFGVLAIVTWSGAAVVSDREHIAYALAEGSDFANREWRDSPTLAWARTQGDARVLFTNWPCAIWFHQHRRTRDVPDDIDVKDARQLARFVERVRATGGAVVLWNVKSGETAAPDVLVERTGLVRVAQFDDGAVYEAPPTPFATPLPPVALPPARR